MPQLDLYIISSQVFWLLLKFNIFYFFILKTYAIEVTKVFKFRKKISLLPKTDTLEPFNPFVFVTSKPSFKNF